MQFGNHCGTSRRDFAAGCVVLLAGAALPRWLRASQRPASAGPASPLLIEDLVAANHILAAEGVLDGYGHVSVRHDRDPNRYLISRSLAPELVTGADILELDLNSITVDGKGEALYQERFIHGEIYKARRDVQAVVHNHSAPLIPFANSGVPLRPMHHSRSRKVAGTNSRQPSRRADARARRSGRWIVATIRGRPQYLFADERASPKRGHGARRKRYLPECGGSA
jgi:class II aldolase/adducin N-terminal domain-containing protein